MLPKQQLQKSVLLRNWKNSEDFKKVTYAPIDLDAIATEELNRDEKLYLNSYHKLVYKKLVQYLSDEERAWLKSYTREV
jgi:Xaa-Pro aminopeptidase